MRRVVLEVGGTEFVTTVETLTSIPGTYFEALFNRWSDGEPSSSNIFLDRDPTHFRHILNFYRNRVVPVGLSAQEKQELSAEAAFYNIQELTSALEGTIQLAIGDTIYLTDGSIEKFGAFLGGYPARSCRICMGMLNPANIFAEQCQLCRIPTDRWVWGCLLNHFGAAHETPKPSIKDVAFKEERERIARHSRFQIEQLTDHCAIIRRVFPETARDVQPIHVPRDFLKK